MLISVPVGFCLWAFYLFPTHFPVIDTSVFGKGTIIETNSNGTILENEYGVRLSLPQQFNKKMIGQMWTLKEYPGFYSLDKHYVDGEERNY